MKLGSRQAFGKPFAAVHAWLIDAVAGTTVVDESAAVTGVARQLGATPGTGSGTPAAKPRTHGVPLFAGAIFTFIAVVAILVALTPLRVAVAHTYAQLIVVRAGFDILWVAIAAIVIAAFLAPLETLGWWAGWYGDDVDPAHPAAQPATNDAAQAATGGTPARYIVYLDGISQSSATYTPDVEAFLDALEPELPPGMVLVARHHGVFGVEPAARRRSDVRAFLEVHRCRARSRKDGDPRHVHQHSQRDDRRGVGRRALRPDV